MGQSGQIQLREHALGLIVAQVPELPSNPGPQTRRVRTRGQQILVVIEFQDERVKTLEMPEKVWRHRAQIGQDPEAPIVCGDDDHGFRRKMSVGLHVLPLVRDRVSSRDIEKERLLVRVAFSIRDNH